MGPPIRNNKQVLPKFEEKLSTSITAVARHKGYWSCGDAKTPVCHGCRLDEATLEANRAGKLLLPRDPLSRVIAIFINGLAYATLCKGINPQAAVEFWLEKAQKHRVGFDTNFTQPSAPAPTPKFRRKKTEVVQTFTYINVWTFPNGLYDKHGQPSMTLCVTGEGQTVDQSGRPVNSTAVCVWYFMRGMAQKLVPSREFLG